MPVCVDQCILLLQYLSNHMHFITNGYKRFLKTNSTDPRQQRVPLKSVLKIITFLDDPSEEFESLCFQLSHIIIII